MTHAEKQDANCIASRARQKIEGNPDLERDMRSEWEKVQDRIDAHIAKSKKRLKVYEAHHLTQTARLAMLTAFVEGKTAKECASAALDRIGINMENHA